MHHITHTTPISNTGIPKGSFPAIAHGNTDITDAIESRVSC